MRCSIARQKNCSANRRDADVDEFEIIKRYFTPERPGPGVVLGVGDDGAVLRPDAGRDLVCVVDTLVEDVHFPARLAAEQVGFRAIAVNVSDIAAMGGRPRWMTLALTLREADPDWLDGFSRGIARAAGRYDVALVGGDMTHGAEIVITVQVLGDIEPDRVLTRSGARTGDDIYLSGTVGDAAAGLSILQSGSARNDDVDFLLSRFAEPEARVALGHAIAEEASAAIDLSDGLYTDLAKLLAASGAGGTIELESLPVSGALGRTMARDDALRFALEGGDDYELCFTAPPGSFGSSVAGVPVTRIGSVTDGSGLACTKGGVAVDFKSTGYRHFK